MIKVVLVFLIYNFFIKKISSQIGLDCQQEKHEMSAKVTYVLTRNYWFLYYYIFHMHFCQLMLILFKFIESQQNSFKQSKTNFVACAQKMSNKVDVQLPVVIANCNSGITVYFARINFCCCTLVIESAMQSQIREQILVPDLYVLTGESVAYKKE